MTGDLVAFLRARLAEDEQAARGAAQDAGAAEWLELPSGRGVSGAGSRGLAVAHGPQDFMDAHVGAHIVRHDPARVLAEVAAKRRILAVYASWQSLARPNLDVNPQENGEAKLVELTVIEILRDLALPYRDHPDYQPAWAPEA